MTWTYHTSPDFRVTTTRFFAAIGYSRNVAQLQAWAREMRRHMRPTSVYSALSIGGLMSLVDGSVTPPPVQLPDGRYRLAMVGRPYRPWYLRELLGQMRSLGLLEVSIVLADTHRESEAALVWDSLSDVLDQSVATPAAQVGGAVLSATEGLGDAAEGLGEGLPELGQGLGDALEGLGNAAASFGEGARNVGAASRWAPTLFFFAVLAGGVWLLKSGAVKVAPIKIG